MKQPKFLSLLILAALPLSAQQLTPEQAVARMKSNVTSSRRAKSFKIPQQLSLVDTTTDGDLSLMYFMNRGDGRGFVILGADEKAPALIGYTDGGSYDSQNLPENFKAWMQGYAHSISAAIKSGKPLKSPSSQHAAIEPLVKTAWNQDAPYNDKCTDRNGDSFGVYTGCVATSMAQVINYHKYPEHGYGENTYQFPIGTNDFTGYSNFAAHTYDWDNMLTTYTSSSSTAAKDAVATLMHDCGVSVNMNYSTSGSGASNNLVAQALINHFGYDRSIRQVTRCYYTDQEWEDMMLAELEASRPVIYSGANTKEGGHSFVLDGYDGNGGYHFNWGWSGLCNGYFIITGDNALNPYTGNSDFGTMGEDAGYGYNVSQAATIGIQPNKGTKDVYVGMGLPGGYTLQHSEYGSAGYQYVNGYLWNTGVLPQKVLMGLKYVNVDDANKIYYDEALLPIERNLTSYALSYYVYLYNITSPGTYYAYPVFKDANDPNAEWKDVSLPVGCTIPTFTWTKTQDKLTAEGITVSNQNAPAVSNQVFAPGAKASITLHANSAIDDQFKIQLTNKSNNTSTYINCEDFTMTAGETKTFDIPLDNVLSGKDLGDYKIRVHTSNISTIYPKYNSSIDISLVENKETISIPITSVGWATYYTNYEYTMPEGVKGYYVVPKANGEGLAITQKYGGECQQTVPAFEPLLIQGAAGTYTATVTSTNATATDASENLLYGNLTKGTVATVAGATSYYKLFDGSQGLGWYLGAENGGVYTLGANKAYLALTGITANAKSMFFEDLITAIDGIESDVLPATPAYNLTGQRITSLRQGQMYIKNGKKYIAR